MFALKTLPGADFAKEIDEVLIKSRARVPRNGKKELGEVAACKQIITAKTIDELNQAAGRTLDPLANKVKFYGGLIHASPYANFEARSKKQGNEARCCELGDLLIILVRTDVVIDPVGNPKIVSFKMEKRACFIQAKLSDVKNGSKVCKFTPKGDLLPAKGEDETQLYLYSEWPEFILSGGTRSYDLTSLIPNAQAACKYGHVLTDADEKRKHPDWSSPHAHVWRQAEPISDSSGICSMGSFVLQVAELSNGAGASYSPASLQSAPDWPELIDDLTNRCRLIKWKGAREANPASIDVSSWLSLQVHAHVQSYEYPMRSIRSGGIEFLMTHLADRHSPRRTRRMKRSQRGDDLPVLIVQVISQSTSEGNDSVEYSAAVPQSAKDAIHRSMIYMDSSRRSAGRS